MSGPNPSRADSRIRYELPTDGRLRVQLFSLDGRLIREIGLYL